MTKAIGYYAGRYAVYSSPSEYLRHFEMKWRQCGFRSHTRSQLSDRRDVLRISEGLGVSPDEFRATMVSRGWEKRPHGVSKRIFWHPPNR